MVIGSGFAGGVRSLYNDLSSPQDVVNIVYTNTTYHNHITYHSIM